VQELAPFTTAAGLVTLGYMALILPDFYLDYDDPSCPSFEVDDEEMSSTIDAGEGCTDSHGTEWSGSMKGIASGDDGEGQPTKWAYTLDAFHYRYQNVDDDLSDGEDDSFVEEVTSDGTFVMEDLADGSVPTFELAMSLGYITEWTGTGEIDEIDWAADYAGTIDDADDGTWLEGEGEVTVGDIGSVYATSVDTHFHESVCEYEYLRGTLSLEGSGAIAELTYDGETDCDRNASVNWTLNGVDRGAMKGGGVCGVASGRPGLLLACLALPLGLVLRRRRG